MQETTLITIPIDYMAIPIKERDAMQNTISHYSSLTFEYKNKIDKLKEICIDTASKAYANTRYLGSIYVSELTEILFEMDEGEFRDFVKRRAEDGSSDLEG